MNQTSAKKKSITSGAEVVRIIEEPRDEYHSLRRILRKDVQIGALVAAWQLTEDDGTRAMLCDFYGYRKARSALRILIGALQSNNLGIRASAAEALGTLGESSAGPALMEALRKETDPEVMHLLAPALGACGYEQAIPALLQFLKGEDLVLVDQAVWALGELHAQEARASLQELLHETSDSWRVAQIRKALARID